MIKQVVKRDGSIEEFDPEKLNRWAQYAAGLGADWSSVALEVVSQLPEVASSEDIESTMILTCLSYKDLPHSRMAARLVYAQIKKEMDANGLSPDSSFKHIHATLRGLDLWDYKAVAKYGPLMEDLYEKVKAVKMEYWQLRQWKDKYLLKDGFGYVVETPQIAAVGIALAIFPDSVDDATDLALSIAHGAVNLPTPVLNGCRNGNWDTISCCLFEAGDSIDSIGVGQHIAYTMTAKKAGIGAQFDTRTKGDPVRDGTVKHLGKHGIHSTLSEGVKMFTQQTRGGSATCTFKAIDPEIMDILLWKTQKVDIERRLDKIDYSFAYNDAFVKAVKEDADWYLFSKHSFPEAYEAFHLNSTDYLRLVEENKQSAHSVVKARDLLKVFLTSRGETGRVYCINLTRCNSHTPFQDVITMSNLCQEIALPTKPYDNMEDLYSEYSVGETAFCNLAAIVVSKVHKVKPYRRTAYVLLKAVDRLIDKAPMMTPSMERTIRERRSVGIGIAGLAEWLYVHGQDYDTKEGKELIKEAALSHYYYLLSASQKLVRDDGLKPVEGVDLGWLPTDTKVNGYPSYCTQSLQKSIRELRGKPRRNSVLVAHMPTESSSLASNCTNGVYPVRERVVYKVSRKGGVQWIAPEGDYKLAWDIDQKHMVELYSILQDWCDQAISADYYIKFSKYPDGKVPLSELMKRWVSQAEAGVKTMYYENFEDSTGDSVHAEPKGCESGACTL